MEEEERPASLARSKSKLNDIRTRLADTEDDYKTTTSNNNTTITQDQRILVKTILKRNRSRLGRRLNIADSSSVDVGDDLRHPVGGVVGRKTKVKIFRRKTDGVPPVDEGHQSMNKSTIVQKAQQQKVNKKKESEEKKNKKRKQKVLLKRRLQKVIETSVELKTRPRTYTYFVTRKNGEGNEEFVASSTEVRDFTYPVTVSKTIYQTQHQQLMTSLVPTL